LGILSVPPVEHDVEMLFDGVQRLVVLCVVGLRIGPWVEIECTEGVEKHVHDDGLMVFRVVVGVVGRAVVVGQGYADVHADCFGEPAR